MGILFFMNLQSANVVTKYKEFSENSHGFGIRFAKGDGKKWILIADKFIKEVLWKRNL